MFFDIPQYFEEELEGKSIPLFGSSPHSLAKDSQGLSFPPLKRIKDVRWTYVLARSFEPLLMHSCIQYCRV